MDHERFDAWTRGLGAPPITASRRMGRRLLIGGALLLALPRCGDPPDVLARKKRGKKKRKKKKQPTAVSPPPSDPCAGVLCGAVPHGETTCSNGVCVLTSCDAGFRTCNDTPADGCECATPGCCRNGSCQTTHANGVGQSFYDCVPLGTHNQTQAEKARAAFADFVGPGQTINSSCGDPGDTSKTVCHNTDDDSVCACWAWSGPLSGFVSAVGGSDCFCPTTSDAPWN